MKDCSNCYFGADPGNKEPCYSCDQNPQTQMSDNWTDYVSASEIPLSKGLRIAQLIPIPKDTD